ncbi:MAG: biotin--[acetyl-CoA-carboxylase] ligase [Succinivibrio sp.]
MGQSIELIEFIRLLLSAHRYKLSRVTVHEKLSKTPKEMLNLIRECKGYGVIIRSTSNYYQLKTEVDLLDQDVIFKGVSGSGRVEVLPQIDSTNSYMLRNSEYLASGDTVLSEIQTAGRGRRGNQWHTSFGKQLMLSTCYVFDRIEAMSGLSLGIGVAVAQSIESFSKKEIQLKWPNDIYYKDRKVGGILIETVPSRGKVKAVIGVGLNIYSDKLDNISQRYTSIYITDSRERVPQAFSRNSISIELINRIKHICQMYEQGDIAPVIEAFEARDFLFGRKIKVEIDQEMCEGYAAGVDKTGSLKIVNKEGQHLISSGHIVSF